MKLTVETVRDNMIKPARIFAGKRGKGFGDNYRKYLMTSVEVKRVTKTKNGLTYSMDNGQKVKLTIEVV